MEQATATTTTVPTPRQGTFQHAATVASAIVPLLEQQPLAVEIEPDWPSGWRVHLKYRETEAAGLFEFATLIDVPVTRAPTAFGVHLDAIARVEDVEVRGSALVSPVEAARLEGLPTPEPKPLTADEDQAAVQPVPLGASMLAELPAIVSVLPAPAVHLDVEDEARCVRCGCTEDAACEAGCYWAPNEQMTNLCSACATPEELAAITYAPAPTAVPESDQ